jgi:hypothetical protein
MLPKVSSSECEPPLSGLRGSLRVWNNSCFKIEIASPLWIWNSFEVTIFLTLIETRQ